LENEIRLVTQIMPFLKKLRMICSVASPKVTHF